MGKCNKIEGVLHLFSETGTEGGAWAFQIGWFIEKNVPRGYCKKCGKWLAKQDGPIQVGRVTLMTAEVMEAVRLTGKLPEVVDCPDNSCEEDIGEAWSYEGLHILEDGDYLTIFDKQDPQKIVWEGRIWLRQYEPFTESTSTGMWIHADQEGVERDVWEKFFLEDYPAQMDAECLLRPFRKRIKLFIDELLRRTRRVE